MLFRSNDTLNTSTTSINRKFSIDKTDPVAVFGQDPIDNYNYTNIGGETGQGTQMTFEFKCYDNQAVSTIQLWTNTTGTWHANYTDSNYINNSWENITISGIPDAMNYKWYIFCNDSVSHTNKSQNRTFNVDTLNPVVIIDSPANNSYFKSAPSINGSCSYSTSGVY